MRAKPKPTHDSTTRQNSQAYITAQKRRQLKISFSIIFLCFLHAQSKSHHGSLTPSIFSSARSTCFSLVTVTGASSLAQLYLVFHTILFSFWKLHYEYYKSYFVSTNKKSIWDFFSSLSIILFFFLDNIYHIV